MEKRFIILIFFMILLVGASCISSKSDNILFGGWIVDPNENTIPKGTSVVIFLSADNTFTESSSDVSGNVVKTSGAFFYTRNTLEFGEKKYGYSLNDSGEILRLIDENGATILLRRGSFDLTPKKQQISEN